MPRKELVELHGAVNGETEKAWRFKPMDSYEYFWLPKSQVEWDEHDSTMTIPEWLALEKGLI